MLLIALKERPFLLQNMYDVKARY